MFLTTLHGHNRSGRYPVSDTYPIWNMAPIRIHRVSIFYLIFAIIDTCQQYVSKDGYGPTSPTNMRPPPPPPPRPARCGSRHPATSHPADRPLGTSLCPRSPTTSLHSRSSAAGDKSPTPRRGSRRLGIQQSPVRSSTSLFSIYYISAVHELLLLDFFSPLPLPVWLFLCPFSIYCVLQFLTCCLIFFIFSGWHLQI